MNSNIVAIDFGLKLELQFVIARTEELIIFGFGAGGFVLVDEAIKILVAIGGSDDDDSIGSNLTALNSFGVDLLGFETSKCSATNGISGPT